MIKNFFGLSTTVIIFFLFLFVFVYVEKNQPVVLKIRNTIVQAELADTPEERLRGLSGREKLGENEGMLFVFGSSSAISDSKTVSGEPDYHGIWMKDMNFPIDIIWVDQNKKIVDIARNISPDSYPQVFKPKEPASYILEVNANFAAKTGIKIGDSIEF